jgi:UDPglucose 6-dehydrogenase
VKKQKNYAIEYTADQYSALQDADALLICTEWSAFRNPDFDKIAGALKTKTIFDGRNLYDLDKMKKLGFFYKSIGRETIADNK